MPAENEAVREVVIGEERYRIRPDETVVWRVGATWVEVGPTYAAAVRRVAEVEDAIRTVEDVPQDTAEALLEQIESGVMTIPRLPDRRLKLRYLLHSWGLLQTSQRFETLRHTVASPAPLSPEGDTDGR